jgi:excisionase family DNA binding protein
MMIELPPYWLRFAQKQEQFEKRLPAVEDLLQVKERRNMLSEQRSTVLYSVPEAAARLKVAPKWLYERTRKNAIPFRRLGKYVRFSEEDLAAIVASSAITTSGIIGCDGNKQANPKGTNGVAGAR